jgi:hypothetical protein
MIALNMILNRHKSDETYTTEQAVHDIQMITKPKGQSIWVSCESGVPPEPIIDPMEIVIDEWELDLPVNELIEGFEWKEYLIIPNYEV